MCKNIYVKQDGLFPNGAAISLNTGHNMSSQLLSRSFRAAVLIKSVAGILSGWKWKVDGIPRPFGPN